MLNYSPIVSPTPASSVKKQQKNAHRKTPLKSSSYRKLSFTTGNVEDTFPFSPLKYEADLYTTDTDSNPTSDTGDVDLKYLQNILPIVL